MNNSYSSLRSAATIFTICGWIQIFSAVILFFMLSGYMQGELAVQGLLYTGGICLLTILLSVFWFAGSQFIKLMINIAENTETSTNNIYLIASKIEEHFNKG
jgi:hypothetical protein